MGYIEDTTIHANIQKDLRIIKTDRALYDAMFAMLSRRNFNSITVNALCTEALVSRAAFYAHYSDKYDLLKYLLREIRKNIMKDVSNYEALEKAINQFIDKNKKVVANILINANDETMGLLRAFMASIVETMLAGKVRKQTSPECTVLFNFIIGGLISQLMWINDHDYPADVRMMNPYLYKMLNAIIAWDAEQECDETAT